MDKVEELDATARSWPWLDTAAAALAVSWALIWTVFLFGMPPHTVTLVVTWLGLACGGFWLALMLLFLKLGESRSRQVTRTMPIAFFGFLNPLMVIVVGCVLFDECI